MTKRKKEEPIEACPFCGEADAKVALHDDKNYAVFCLSCGARGSVKATKEEAIDIWNQATNWCM
jgi:Lar family restriction alleviation protein